jgi:hypothetical protein
MTLKSLALVSVTILALTSCSHGMKHHKKATQPVEPQKQMMDTKKMDDKTMMKTKTTDVKKESVTTKPAVKKTTTKIK